jgi:hypothetical protein
MACFFHEHLNIPKVWLAEVQSSIQTHLLQKKDRKMNPQLTNVTTRCSHLLWLNSSTIFPWHFEVCTWPYQYPDLSLADGSLTIFYLADGSLTIFYLTSIIKCILFINIHQ